jgi:hypothetical protein
MNWYSKYLNGKRDITIGIARGLYKKLKVKAFAEGLEPVVFNITFKD